MAIEKLDQFLTNARLEASTSTNTLMKEVTNFLVEGNIERAKSIFEEASSLALKIREIDALRSDFRLSAITEIPDTETITEEQTLNISDAKDQSFDPRERLLSILQNREGKPSTRKDNPITLTIQERDHIVRELREQGMGPSKIVEETGLSFSLVLSSTSRIKYDEVKGIYAKHLVNTDEYLEKVRELRSKGYKQKEIRQLLGITLHQLNRLVNILCVQKRSIEEVDSAQELDKAVEQLNSDLTFAPEVIIPIPSPITVEEFGGLSRVDISHIATVLFLHRERLEPFLKKKGIKYIEADILSDLINLAGNKLTREIAIRTKEEVRTFLHESRITALEKAEDTVSSPNFDSLIEKTMEDNPNVGYLLIHLSELNEIVRSGDKEGLCYIQELQKPLCMEIRENIKTGFIESVKFRTLNN